MSAENDLKIEIVKLQSDLLYLKDRLIRVEQESIDSNRKRERNTEEIQSIRMALSQIEESIDVIKNTLTRLDENVFLQFTNDIDIKKLITIVIIASTFITSPTLIQNFLDIAPDPQEEKIDKLIQILENNNNANP